MVKSWDTYSRQGLDIASVATSFGFSAVKSTTKLGFAVTKGIASTAVGLTTAIVDHAFFGGSTVTRPVIGGALSTAFSLAEQITLAPIFLSEYITSTSLIAAHGSINVLSIIFPGSSDASFSLASIINLVRREWKQPHDERLPAKHYGITQIARAIIAWVALQGVTQEWQERRWFHYLREIHVRELPENSRSILRRRNSRVRVTSDIIYPNNSAQIIAADIGEAPIRAHSTSHALSLSPIIPSSPTIRPRPRPRTPSIHSLEPPPPRLANGELKSTLRRLSKIVLAGYGGASLLFFGVSPSRYYAVFGSHGSSSLASEMASEERQLAHAIDASEAEAAGGVSADSQSASADSAAGPDSEQQQYSWWDVLLGKHDQEIFERAAGLGTSSKKAKEEIKAKMTATAVIGSEHMMPRFWVLTDHGRGQIVLVLRGTMSVNEIAADLTCEPEEFEPATTICPSFDPSSDSEPHSSPSTIPFPSSSQYNHPSTPTSPTTSPLLPHSKGSSTKRPLYFVHGGMLRMARAMGDKGKPVQLAVKEALLHNPGYELVMCGHSLGAGVAAILGMTWADPKTCLTVRSSDLPVGRRVSIYCFAPPALTDVALSKLADRLVTSFVYSHDVVSRLSLGAVRDLRNAALWLCDAESNGKAGEGWAAVTSRAKQWKAGVGSQDDPDWFIAVRKTLEANMQMTNMFPPGRVLWGIRDSELHPSHRSYIPAESSNRACGPDKLRLFEVLDVERVFSQIVFARDMLLAHLPHQYDRVLHDLL
ncbi:alpha/beta-hydrolase [Tricholoma matsutake]|nr:alpha/beta-hydrolase [Tricholoma matsutake 945]